MLSGDFDPKDIDGSVIFFGLTSTSLGDSVPTPILGEDQPLPGVEVHANIYSCLLYTSPSPRDKRQSRMPSSA